MKKFIWLALAAVLTLNLCACSAPVSYLDKMEPYTPPQILSTVTAGSAGAGEKCYAERNGFSLYVNEANATFSVTDANGNRWNSCPNGAAEEMAVDELTGLIQVHFADQMGNTYELNSLTNSVATGHARIHAISGGARIEFTFAEYGFVVPVHVTLCDTGVEFSVITADIRENNALFKLTSVDVAPYFHAAHETAEGYIFLPDGAGALLDWSRVTDPSVEYRQYIYGRDAAIVQMSQTAQAEPIRLPVFGILQNGTAVTAIVTEGASRTALNATAAGKRNAYSNVYAEFIYRETALVKVEKKNQTVTVVETSNTAVPVQTVRFCLMSGEDLSYVDMADAYRQYLLQDCAVTPTAGDRGAPLVLEFCGGVMKQQFVMGFPVEQVVPLTTFADAQRILAKLREAGADNILVNYTQWQKDATGAGIQTQIQPEGNLGGAKALKQLTEFCQQQGISLFLDANTNRMMASTFGYDKKNDAASSVRRDPAMQYPYRVNTGDAIVGSPSFLLAVSRLPQTAQKLAESAENYGITGLSSTFLGDILYSDFCKAAITRDHAELFWNDALQSLSQAKGKLLVSGGNAYALAYADVVMDAPTGDSGFLITCESVPFYQIALHGVVDLTTAAINCQADPTRAFLQAVETGSCLKWSWIARNQDELVETEQNDMISWRYENWLRMAASQYARAGSLLQKLAGCTVVEHARLPGYADVVRVLWSDGTEVIVNYEGREVQIDGRTIPATDFAVREVAQ